jgi:eukaryotic-like serine/threonine-protein kinase
MKNERSERIEKLYHAASELASEQRPRFLDEACHGDMAMRRRIEVLLANDSEQDSFLKTPAVDLAGAPSRTPLPQETRLGPYEIQQLAGAGGMGQTCGNEFCC